MGKVFKALNKSMEKDATDLQSPSGIREEEPVQEIEQQTKGKGEQIMQEKIPAHDQQSSVVPTQWDERLTLAVGVKGAVAESFRTLRTRILHPATGTPPRSILVTSASPEEGKSFVSANLAISLAQGVDQFSLLVDCDFRRPALHKLFGLPNEQGLVDYLRDRVTLEELIVATGVPKLSFLAAGTPPDNPAELLGSGAMGRMVDELSVRYTDRIVLFDSPPLQAASETAVLAQHVDGVVLVVRSGGSRREHVKALVETIGLEKIIGVVFNAYTSTMLDAKIFGYYEYQDKYYYEKK